MKTAVATVTLLWAAVVLALPKKDLKPSEIFLKNLPTEKLDALMASRLQELEDDIVESYDTQLREHEDNLKRLHRHRRDVTSRNKTITTRTYHHHAPTYWHSYTYDAEIGNREKLNILDIDVKDQLGNVNIIKVFSLDLWNLSTIYQSESHVAYVLKGGRLEAVKVRNRWTKSLVGCPCDQQYLKSCACCEEGACRCGAASDTCVQCGLENDLNICAANGPRELELDAAVGFQYYLDYYDLVQGVQRVLVASRGTTVSFYKFNKDSVQLMQSETGLGTINFARPVTHLGYGETFKDFYGIIRKDRFLITFRAGDSSQQFHGINIDSTGLASGTSEVWQAFGTEMKAWQSGGRVMLAVLNGMDLFVYELKANHRHEYRMRKIQTLSIGEPIIYWKSFCMGFEKYLVVVTRKISRLYLHSGMHYQTVQDLTPSHGLTAFTAIVPISISSWRGKAVLLTGEGKRLLAYVWNGAKLVVEVSHVKMLNVSITDWSIVYGHADMKLDSNLVFVPTEKGPMRLEVKATLEDLPDPILLQNQELHQLLNTLEGEFQRQSEIIDLARDRLAHSIEGQNTINADIVVVGGIVVNGTLDTWNLEANSIILQQIDSSGKVTFQGYQDHLNSLGYYEGVLNTLNATLTSLHRKLDDAVPASGTSRLITGVKTLVGEGLQVATLSTDHLTVRQTLDWSGNLFPLDDILRGLVRQNDTRVIAGQKTFLKDLKVVDLYAEYLDDIPVDDIVTTDGSQTIAGASFASGLRAETIHVTPGGTVGGIDLSEDAVLLSGEATLGSCTFKSDLSASDIVAVSKFVDGVDLDRLNTSALTTSGGTVKSSLVFSNSLTLHTLQARFIMGVDTDLFMSTTVFKHRTSAMRGTLVIPSGVDINGDLVVEGKINGQNFPKDFPLQTDSTINFGAKRFANVFFDTLRVGTQCLVDGLSLHKLVTLHTPQTITGQKTFAQGVYIKGDLDITSKIIDGVNLDELNASLSYIGSSEWEFDVVFNKAVQAPSLSFGGRLNNLDWATFARDIVYDDETSVVIASKKNFKLGLTISNAIFQNTFNGVSFGSLVTLSSTQNIYGKKVFANDVTFGSLTVDLLDGVDLEQLARTAVYLNKEGQVVTGKKTFTSLLTTKALDVTGRIENFDIRNLVTKNTDQTFTAAQSFRSVVFSDLQAVSIDLPAGYTINTIDIANLEKSRVSLTSPSVHSGVLTVQGPVTVLGQLSVDTINGYDINLIMNNLVMKDESSVITGDITFVDLTVQGPITTLDLAGANGLNISSIDHNAVKVTGNVEMSGAVTWGPVVLQRDVSVEGLVNGIPLFNLSQDVVYRDAKNLQVITGKKTFEAGITVNGDIVTTSVNDIDLGTRMLTRHTVQTISAPYTFFNVEARGTVNILGLYNNINLTQLASEGRLGANDTIYGNVTFLREASVGNLVIRGTFNGVDVERRMADAVLVRDPGVISGRKTLLANMTTFTNLRVNSLNKVPLDFYLKHVVLKNATTTIDHKIVVQGSVTTPSLTADTLIVQGTVDGIDYNKFLSEAVYLHKNQTIDSTLVFMRDVTVHGDINTVHLNGMNLEKDFLTTDTEQTIPFSVTFGSIESGDVAVGGRVNSWYLPDEVNVTMKAVGGQTVTGRLTIGGTLEVLGDVTVSGLVGTEVKVDLSKQAVQLHRNTEIYGSLTFTSPVTASTLTCVPGIVNDINIPELFANAWYIDKATDITGFMIFEGPVLMMEALLRNATLPSVKLIDLEKTVTNILADFNRTKLELEALYKSACSPVIRLYSHLERAIFEGDHFASVFEYPVPYHRRSSTSFLVQGESFVVMSWEAGRCDSALYKFIPATTSMDRVKTIIGSGYAHQWLFLGGTEKRVFLAMAASDRNNSCKRTNSAIWSVTENAFRVHHELAPGESLSQISRGSEVMVFVHGSDGSVVYTLDLSIGTVKQFTHLPDIIDFSTTLTTKMEIDVIFQSYKGNGVLIVRGSKGLPIQIAHRIYDGVLLEHHEKVYLLLAVTRVKMHKENHVLELYSVNLHKRTVNWVDAHVMAARLQLAAFFAGVPTTGSYIIVALQESRVPVVYTLLGETLKEMAHLSTPRVAWVQHMPVVHGTITGVLEHYLLLGQADHNTVLARLVMKGAALPKMNLTCDFNDPGEDLLQSESHNT
nr:uncharacterized protein LOC123774561 [Procambarus clarkii]